MERNSKRIIAIVAIAAIIVGGGLGAWWFFNIGVPVVYETPGVEGIPDDQIIKIGLIGPFTEIQGLHAYQGAWIAAYQINTANGILVNGKRYYVGLIKENTDEASTQLDTTIGINAAKRLLYVDNARYIIGGFRTEAVLAYMEEIMNEKRIFLGTGAADDSITLQLNSTAGYEKYKYFFRMGPHNSTGQGGDIVKFALYLSFQGMPGTAYYYNLTSVPAYAGCGYPGEAGSLNISRITILRENLDWTLPLYAAINKTLVETYGLTPKDKTFAIGASATDFEQIWSEIEATQTQLVIPIISAQGGTKMMQKYADLTPKCLIAGVDVEAQTTEFWDATQQKATYEIFASSAATLNTSISSHTVPFHNAFVEKWNHVPIYTATGSFDSVHHLIHAINDTQSFDELDIIAYMEQYNSTNPLVDAFAGAQQNAWWATHDLVAGYPGAAIVFGQWQAGGEQIAVSAGGIGYPWYQYPDSLAQGAMQLPPWGIWGTPVDPFTTSWP